MNMQEAGTWKELTFEDQQVVNKILQEYEHNGIDFSPEK
jgi:Zn-dependent oligopeptidase